MQRAAPSPQAQPFRNQQSRLAGVELFVFGAQLILWLLFELTTNLLLVWETPGGCH